MKKLYLTILLSLIFIPNFVFAQTDNVVLPSETFKAKILNIVEEKTITRDDGSTAIQQNIRLKGLGGTWKNKEFFYNGISDIDVLSQNAYKAGEKVMVTWEKDFDGVDQFYIVQYVRDGYLYLLAGIFAIIIILIGRGKGIRSLLSLLITFFVIIKFIIPLIMSGHNPLLISLVGAFFILLSIIYVTEGLNKKTHIAIVSVVISLSLTFIISWIFVHLTRLTGFASEDTTFLVGTGSGIVDFRGLLLAGILIGTLGVLDDVILGQIETISEIKRLNPGLSNKEIIKTGSKIGRTHLSSMVNTLFLTYAGASLPLLILFSLYKNAGTSFVAVINNEAIATEIVRTLSGSIGLALAFPITTLLAVYFLKNKK
ncbi:MAG: YibE/F family protein [Candidatus Magasanikiibacteriota bacterium]